MSRVDHYYHLSLGPTLLPIVILYIAAASKGDMTYEYVSLVHPRPPAPMIALPDATLK